MTPDIQKLAKEIQAIHQAQAQNSELLIEQYLDDQLALYPLKQKLSCLAALKTICSTDSIPAEAQTAAAENDIMIQFCRLLLGKSFSSPELNTEDVPRRLSLALNTVFDALNQLVTLIDSTFAVDHGMGETIRHIISSDLGPELSGDSPSKSLEEYINQIRIAFLTSQQAFKNAAHQLTDKILYELDPEQMDRKKSKSFKIGPLHKAEKFEKYEQTYTDCKKWFDSGRFMEEFLREFEKNCQKLSAQPRR